MVDCCVLSESRVTAYILGYVLVPFYLDNQVDCRFVCALRCIYLASLYFLRKISPEAARQVKRMLLLVDCLPMSSKLLHVKKLQCQSLDNFASRLYYTLQGRCK